MTENIKI